MTNTRTLRYITITGTDTTEQARNAWGIKESMTEAEVTEWAYLIRCQHSKAGDMITPADARSFVLEHTTVSA
jgi:hypothetical protein